LTWGNSEFTRKELTGEDMAALESIRRKGGGLVEAFQLLKLIRVRTVCIQEH
jgi:hypothetical protein